MLAVNKGNKAVAVLLLVGGAMTFYLGATIPARLAQFWSDSPEEMKSSELVKGLLLSELPNRFNKTAWILSFCGIASMASSVWLLLRRCAVDTGGQAPDPPSAAPPR